MKTIIVLSALLLLATGCAAWHSLVVHPLEKVHEMHEYNERQKTNHVQ